MKNLLFALILLFTVTSCLPKKDKDIEPDLAGTYTMSKYAEDRVEYISRGATGTVSITKRDDSHIDISYTVRYQGQSFPNGADNVEIRKASGKNYDIYDDGDRAGSINGTDFSLDTGPSGGDRIEIVARK